MSGDPICLTSGDGTMDSLRAHTAVKENVDRQEAMGLRGQTHIYSGTHALTAQTEIHRISQAFPKHCPKDQLLCSIS